jgi:Cu2+-exporting ATPase
LFKNASAIETSARIDTVVMDKTGTPTRGEPAMTREVAPRLGEADALRLAAAVEAESEHPLARAVVRHAEEAGMPRAPAGEFRNVPGHGAVADVDGQRVAVGNRRLMDREGIEVGDLGAARDELAAEGQTAVFVAVDGRVEAVVGLADAPRETAGTAVAALREAGTRVVMLTGDNEATARRIAGQLGISEVIAEVLPADKSAKVADLQWRAAGSRWSATASTTRRRSRRPTSASRLARAPMWRSRPPTWC